MLTAKPLNFTNINSFAFAERLDLVQGNAQTCYIQLLSLTDTLLAPQGMGLFGGVYASNQVVTVPLRYVPAAGATVQIVFPRALSVQNTPSNQDVTVTGVVADSRDASIYRFDLTATNVDKIVGEGVKLVITEGGVTKTYPVDHFVRRRSNAPGA